MDQPQLFLNAKWFINSMFEAGQIEFDAKKLIVVKIYGCWSGTFSCVLFYFVGSYVFPS